MLKITLSMDVLIKYIVSMHVAVILKSKADNSPINLIFEYKFNVKIHNFHNNYIVTYLVIQINSK